MFPFILVSTRGNLDHLKFTDPIKAEEYCEKMARCGIAYKMEVF